MVYDVKPAKELTGGPWYTDQEFDHDFVYKLTQFVLHYLGCIQLANASQIYEAIQASPMKQVLYLLLLLLLLVVVVVVIVVVYNMYCFYS